MSSRYLFEDGPPSPQCGQPCYKPVEDIWEHVEQQLCKPKKKCCPPLTRARDAILVADNERTRCFHYGRRLCDGSYEQQVVNRLYRMDIRQQGFCDVLMCIPPYQATMDGAICWAWPDEFKRLPTGYYEGDVFIDGCRCHTHLFYIQECNVMAVTASVEVGSDGIPCETCGGADHSRCGCADNSCCAAVPMVDDDVCDETSDGCETECKGC